MNRELSIHDRRLVAALKKDGRASITNLAAMLGLSRVTVQSRLERLVKTGIIQRFTVELDASAELDLVRAIMLIEVEGTRSRSVTTTLKQFPEIVSLHTTNGAWDLIANVETSNLAEFDRLLREVREVRGVLNSQTNIMLNRARS